MTDTDVTTAEIDELVRVRAERLIDGSTWDDFCDVLRAAGKIVLRESPDADPVDRAEGFRYLTRILLMSFFRSMERVVPGARPQHVAVIPPGTGGIGVQSPNQDHVVQPVDARHVYRIRGQRGTAPYVHVSAWAPRIPDDVAAVPLGLDAEAALDRFDPNANATPFTALLDDYADGDGNVDMVVAVDEPDTVDADPKAWFPVSSVTREVMMRVVYSDRSVERPPALTIERLSPADAPRAVPEPDDIGSRLATSAQLLLGMVSSYGSWTQSLVDRENSLELTPLAYEAIGGSPDDRHFEFGYFRVGPDEALVVEFEPVECLHWNFQLCNHWMENFSGYSEGRGFLSADSAEPGPDGKVRIVVAQENPGLGDRAHYVSPCDHTHGVMGLRFVQPQTKPASTTRLVKRHELEASLA